MSRHYGRRVHPQGFRLAGLSGGFGNTFDLGLTSPKGGVPISNSVQTSEMQVTGTFAARAPALLNEAATYDTMGMLVHPTQYLENGEVYVGQAAPSDDFMPTMGSPMATVRAATQTATGDVTQARDENLTPGAGYDPNSFPGAQLPLEVQESLAWQAEAAPAKGEWWHWALLGGAVLGGVYAFSRTRAR